ncbi:MAG: aspartate aminotransferase, aspartate aminotransferase [Candidatus Gottesmanbacteria bacterium GW2011_GWA2_43_14]|uniref:Aminotransferase n=1 Tax=Candidatus Gottesmanbacteria bacterium GW2011_GWA2_43_14 TaxID=1618443 RepID=A0A0G1GB10_9BACT|nr:MAG: aspartate aminotransferase, aspartate aminotransferase [Candidatus Gottesmanbacteria bacterium GW2011_GWA2_43_14]
MKTISPSRRALEAPASAIRKLVPLADAAKKRGIKVYHVNIGQPDLPTPAPVMKAIREFPEKTLEYAPSAGIREALEAWETFYRKKKFPFSVQDLLITSGGSEGLIFAFFAVTDPGDEIIMFEPFYTSYAIIAAMGAIRIVPVTTQVEDGYHLPDKKTIEGAITSKTRAILVCNPNNPTGTLYRDEEVKLIKEIALERNLFIISDETYQEIVFDGRKALPFVTFPEVLPNLIVADSVSKRFNACGARVGCLASKNAAVMASILKFAQARLSVATVDQLAMIPILKNHREYINGIRKTYEARRNTLVTALSEIEGVTFRRPEGAFYLMPRLPITDSDDFARFLLEDYSDKGETLMVAPATGFYKTEGLGKSEIRIAYVLEQKKLVRAIAILNAAIKAYNSR